MYRISGIGAAGSLDSAAESSSSSVLGGNTTLHRFYSSVCDYLRLQGESFPQANSVMGDLRAFVSRLTVTFEQTGCIECQ